MLVPTIGTFNYCRTSINLSIAMEATILTALETVKNIWN